MARKIIELYQPIDKWEMSGELFARMLREADGSVVELRINSPGGDVGEGFSIANQIKQYSGKVVAVIEGYCASVATIIALACSEVHMHELSAWMMHRSSGGARGNSEDMTSAAKALAIIDQMIADTYKAKSGASDEQVAQWLAVDTWMAPSEALAAKLIDKVITDKRSKATASARAFQIMASCATIPDDVRARVEQAEQDPPKPQAAATPQPAPKTRGNMIKNPKIQALLALGLSAFAQAGALAKAGDDDEKALGTMLDGIDVAPLATAAGDVKQDAGELLSIKAALVSATGKTVGLPGVVDALAMTAAMHNELGTETRAAKVKRLLDEAVTPTKATGANAMQKPRKLTPEQAIAIEAQYATNGRPLADLVAFIDQMPALPELNMAQDHGVTAPGSDSAAPGMTADEQKQLEAEILASINRNKIHGVA